MPEDKAGFVVSPHSLPNPKQHMVQPDRWLPMIAVIHIKTYLQRPVQILSRFYYGGISYFFMAAHLQIKQRLITAYMFIFLLWFCTHMYVPLSICKCVQLRVNCLSSLCFYSWLIVCVCECECVRKKNRAREEKCQQCVSVWSIW